MPLDVLLQQKVRPQLAKLLNRPRLRILKLDFDLSHSLPRGA
jgi:hypothetical protein